jgi:hypothetical protein
MKNFFLWVELEWYNIKRTLIVLLGVMFLIIAMNQAPKYMRELFVQKFDLETYAVIDTIIFINGFKSTLTGEKPVIKFFKMHYQYTVDGIAYKREESIARELISIKNRAKFLELSRGDSILIKYSESTPSKAFIKIK